ncbi:MAG TPA: thioredoxin family protein [Planctomycetota bacterium]|nr:thioredoxin family protein [Planctomycetota bacterium]
MSKTKYLFASLAVAALGVAALAPRVAAADKEETERPMAPAFKVKDYDGKERTLEEFKGKYVVLEWVNLECPFVKKHYNGSANMQKLQKTYADKGVVWLAICSSAAGKQGHLTPEGWKTAYTEKKMAATTVLIDGDGAVGKAYGAKTTPHMWIIGPKGTIEYTGAIDDDRNPQADPAKTKNFVAGALDALLAGKEPPVRETPPYGCSVKYAD